MLYSRLIIHANMRIIQIILDRCCLAFQSNSSDMNYSVKCRASTDTIAALYDICGSLTAVELWSFWQCARFVSFGNIYAEITPFTASDTKRPISDVLWSLSLNISKYTGVAGFW